MADEKLPDITTVFADPDFRQLSSVEKINALDRYPDFKQLPLQEKVSAIQIGLEKIRMGPRRPGFWGTIGEVATGMAGEAWQRFRDPFGTAKEEYTQSAAWRANEAEQAAQAAALRRPGEFVHRVGRAIAGPTLTSMGHESLEEFRKAGREYQSGERMRFPGTSKQMPVIPGPKAIAHAAAGVVPIQGPAAAQAGEEFERGEYGPAWAHTALLLGPDIVSAGFGLAESATGQAVRSALKSRLTGTQAARFAATEARARAAGYTGRMFTRGEEAGKVPMIRMERAAEATPGSAGPAERMYTARAAELERQAGESIERVAPTAPAGTAMPDVSTDVYTEAGQTIKRQQRAATKVYDQVRANAAKAKEWKRIGTKVEVRPDKYNPKIKRRVAVPIMEQYEAPVALQQYRQGLRPLWDEFHSQYGSLPESERMAMPGYQSLRRIMDPPVHPRTGRAPLYMNAMDLESELREIKQIYRNDRMSNFLHSPSGRVALRIIDHGERLVGQALEKAQPGTYALLEQGRAMVRQYKAADQLVTRIVGKGEKADPTNIFKAMTRAGDQKYYEIYRLAQIAPNASKVLWRNYLEGLMENALKDTGRLERGSGAKLVTGFDHLGKRTKQLAFGPQLTQELDDVFRAIKDVNPQVGSPTAEKLIAIGGLGAAGEALNLLIGFHPLSFVGFAAKTATLAGAANILSRLWFAPGGAAATARMLRAARIGGAVFRESMRAWEAHVAVAQGEQRREEEQRQRDEAPPAAEAPVRPDAAPSSGTIRMEGGEIPRESPIIQAGQRAASAYTPPEGTDWRYWGLKPPADDTEAARLAAATAPMERGRPREQRTAGPGGINYGWPTGRAGASAPARTAAASPAPRPRAGGVRSDFTSLYQQVGQSTGVPPGLLHTIAQLESNGNPNAIGGKGERGLMQFMPKTWRALGIDPMDPQQAVQGAGQLLRVLMRKYHGVMWKVLAAYNEGETAFDRRQRQSPGFQSLPASTQDYVRHGLRLLGQGGGQRRVAETVR